MAIEEIYTHMCTIHNGGVGGSAVAFRVANGWGGQFGIVERRKCNQRICFASTKIHRSETLAIKVKSSYLLEIQYEAYTTHTHTHTHLNINIPIRMHLLTRTHSYAIAYEQERKKKKIQRNIPKSVS